MDYDGKEALQIIKVRIVRHTTTKLMVAISDDLKGLMVAGDTEADIEGKLAGAVREILEAKGHKIISVSTEPDQTGIPSDFSGAAMIANVRVATH